MMTKHAALLAVLKTAAAKEGTTKIAAGIRARMAATGYGMAAAGLAKARTLTSNALAAGRAMLQKAHSAPRPEGLSPLGTPWAELKGRPFREIHNAMLGQAMGSRAVPTQFPSKLHTAKYRAAIGTPRELGRENAYLSAAMDPSDARNIALKAKGVHARAQTYGAPAFPKTSSASLTSKFSRDSFTMTKHAALLSMLKVAAAQEAYHGDTRRAGILCILKTAAAQEGTEKKAFLGAAIRGAVNAGRGLVGAARPGAALANSAAAARGAASTARQGSRAAMQTPNRQALMDLAKGQRITRGSDLHRQLEAAGGRFRPAGAGAQAMTPANAQFLAQEARAVAAKGAPLRRVAATQQGRARGLSARAQTADRGYGAGQAVRQGAQNLWGAGRDAAGALAIRGQHAANAGLQGAQRFGASAGQNIAAMARNPATAALAGGMGAYGLGKIGSDARTAKIAAMAGLLRGIGQFAKAAPKAATKIRPAMKQAPRTSATAKMPKAPSALAQVGSGAMQALRRPGAVLAGAGAGAYGLSKMSSADLALVKVAARIINADVGLDAIIAHIKAAKARRVVAA